MSHYLVLVLLLISLVGCKTGRYPGDTPGYSATGGYYNDDSPPRAGRLSTQSASCMPDTEGPGVLSAARLEILDPEAITGIAFDPSTGDLLLRTPRNIRVWDPVQGRQRSVRADKGDTAFLQELSWPDGGIKLYLNAAKGSLEVLSGSGAEPLASIWLSTDSWAVVDTQGRFDADSRSWRYFNWRSGSDSLSFVQLADLYFEPALLGKVAAGAELNTPDAPAISSGVALPPQSQLDVRLSDDASRVFGSVKVKRGGGCIGNVRVFHNDKAIRVQAPEKRNPDANEETWRFTLPIQAGRHRFRATAASAQKVEGTTASAELRVEGRTNRQSRAYVLVIGIDDYANPALRLDFAVADGEGVVAWANGLESGPHAEFDEVSITRVYDKEATRARILRELGRLQSVDAQDTVIIYLAGHGENDGVRWFFLPAEFGREISFEAVAVEGISSEILQQALIKIPARRIALVVDACKSGDLRNVFSAATDSRYLEWVSRTAGVQLLAATDQEQLAVELPELGHGALTYTLLRGLSGQADALPGNRVVTARELFRYAEQSLPEITRRIIGVSQYPVVFEYGPDFPLQRLRRN